MNGPLATLIEHSVPRSLLCYAQAFTNFSWIWAILNNNQYFYRVNTQTGLETVG